ncbi:MAG: hypothetical protein ACOYOH_20060 [Paracraurococcus sp.]
MAGRLFWCLVPALLLGACSPPDYTPVRDWAGGAADAAAWTRAAAGPGQPGAPESERRRAIAAQQAALEAWFTALSTIAADGLVRRMEDPLVAEAAAAAAFDPEAGEAVGALGALLVTASKANWRAPQTATAIRAADPVVATLLRRLSEAVAGLAAGDAARREAIEALYAPLEAGTRDPAARQAIREWRAQREAEVAAGAAARDAYRAVLARIAEGQAVLLERSGHLRQEETARQVRAAETALRRAAALLPPAG